MQHSRLPDREAEEKMQYFELKKLSEKTSLSIYTLRKMAREDNMPHQRVGKKIFVDPDKFKPWFEANFQGDGQRRKSSIEEVFKGIGLNKGSEEGSP